MIKIIETSIIILGLLFMILGIKKPLLCASYAVFCLPFQGAIPIISSIRINQYAILIWLACFIFHLIIERIRLNNRTALIFVFLLIYTLAITLIMSLFTSFSYSIPIEYIRLFVSVIFPITLILYFKNTIKTSVIYFMKIIVLSGLFVSIISITNVFLEGYSIRQYFMSFFGGVYDFYKLKFTASPFYDDPNNYAGFLNVVISCSLILFFKNRKKIFLISAFISLISLFLTLSRGGYLGLLAGLVVAMMINKKTRVFGVASIIVSTYIGFKFLLPYFSGDNSAISRIGLWKVSIEMFEDYPLFGSGLGQYTAIFGNYISGDTVLNPYSHNLFLRILAEFGIVGVVCSIIFIFVYFRNHTRNITKNKDVVSYGFLICFVAFIAQGLTVEYLTSYYFWLMIILGFEYSRFSPYTKIVNNINQVTNSQNDYILKKEGVVACE